MISIDGNLVKKEFILNNALNETINGDIYYYTHINSAQAVIILHGFKGYKDWGFLPILSKNLATAGNIVINFDFSRNGIIDSNKQLYDTEKFASNLISIEINDILTLIDAIETGGLFDDELKKIWNCKISLIGFSRGAGIAILASTRRKIEKLALLAPIATFNRYTKRQIENWEKSGKLFFKNNVTNQELYINFSYMEEILANEIQYNLINAISTLKIPVLIIHGEQDLTVNINESKMLYEAINSDNKQFILIKKVGHTFNATHLYKNEIKEIKEITQHLYEFL